MGRTAAQKIQRHIIVVRGDTHCGQVGGLTNPETQIPDIDIDEKNRREITGYSQPKVSPIQRKIWAWHEEARTAIGVLAGKDPITFVDMGDLTQGGYLKDGAQETAQTDQYFLSKYTMIPWMKMPQLQRVYMTRGSPVHTWFRAGESLLAHTLSIAYPRIETSLATHWMLNVDGVLIDIAHHGPHPGKRSWLRGNEFMWYMKSILIDDISSGDEPPQIILRAHKHEFTRAWAWHQASGKFWDCFGVVTPPMAYINDYAQIVTQSISRVSIGLIALEIINGRLHQAHPFVRFIDLRRMEIVP